MKIIYTTESGIAIIHPTGELSTAEVLLKDVPEQYRSSAKIVEDDFIPSDRTFRNTWKLDKNKIVEDLEKAKEIHKDRLRTVREPLLAEQDVLYLKAMESGADTKDIIKEKQRLRDITKAVDSCKSVSDIKKVIL
jgi:hypothetical protein